MFLFFLTKELRADPLISSVNGSFDQGSTATITGSAFGTRGNFAGSSHAIPSFLPVVWKDFEDHILNSDGLTEENAGTNSWVVESVTPRIAGNYYGKRKYDATDGRIQGLQKVQHGTTGNWFFSFWILWPSVANLGDIDGGKQWRIFGDPTTSHNMYMSSVDDSSELVFQSEYPPCSCAIDTLPGNKLGEWERIDIAMTQSPDQFIVYRNMQKKYCIASDTSAFTNCNTYVTKTFVHNPFNADGHTFVFGHMIDGPGAPAGENYTGNGNYKEDDLYADYSLAHIEVCSKSTWNALLSGGGTNDNHCEIQIPTNWVDTSISINFNAGSFATGTAAYLYVITENNTAESFDVNANGFPITIGATGGGGGSPGTPHTGLNGKSKLNGKAVLK